MTAPPPAPTALAAHHLRLFALIVDTLLALVAVNLLARAALGAAWDLHPPAAAAPYPLWVGALALLVLRDVIGGRSVGKWLTGIAAVRADDPAAVPRPAQLVLRHASLLLLPVDAVLVFTDPYCRRLGDRIAGTVVVAAPRPAPITRRLLGISIAFLLTMLLILVVEYWNVRRSAAYRVALEAARTDRAVRTAFGADAEIGAAPGLQRSADGRTMEVTLGAEGTRAEGTVHVRLRLEGARPAWRVERVTVDGPAATELRVEDAPPRQ